MEYTQDRKCVRCGLDEENVHLEGCRVCYRFFCGDCAFRAVWGRFCSETCAKVFYYGDADDDDQQREDLNDD